jgi:hypothetical protein
LKPEGSLGGVMPVACQSVFSDVSTNDSFSSDWLEILKFKALQIDTNRVEDLNRARSLDAPLAAGRPGFAEAASPGCKRPVQAGRLTHIGADDHRDELRRVPKARRHRIVASFKARPPACGDRLASPDCRAGHLDAALQYDNPHRDSGKGFVHQSVDHRRKAMSCGFVGSQSWFNP